MAGGNARARAEKEKVRTAIDTSALLAIFNGERTGKDWLRELIGARRQGQLTICDIVYAELAPGFSASKELDEKLAVLGIVFEPVNDAAAFRAGKAFAEYRKRGGPRTHIIPDFLIAAHAEKQADRLAAEDRGYLRDYFGGLPLISI